MVKFTTLFDNYCPSCDHDSRSEIEFYCKTCEQPICRNCLLKNHINLSVGKKDNQEELKEKTELLNQYERKTMTERQTISLTHELKIEAKGKDYHEIMDIKLEFSLVFEHKEQTQKLLSEFLDLRDLYSGLELDEFDESRFQPLDMGLKALVRST